MYNSRMTLKAKNDTAPKANRTIPNQVLVRAARARNKRTDLVHGTSIFETRATIATGDARVIENGLRLFRPEDALISASRPVSGCD